MNPAEILVKQADRATRAQTVMRAWQDYKDHMRALNGYRPLEKHSERALRLAFLAGAAWHIGLMQDQLDKARSRILKEL